MKCDLAEDAGFLRQDNLGECKCRRQIAGIGGRVYGVYAVKDCLYDSGPIVAIATRRDTLHPYRVWRASPVVRWRAEGRQS